MAVFIVEKPSTIYLKNINPVKRVNVFLNGMLYFFRYTQNLDQIKFNVKHAGKYTTNAGSVLKIVPIEIEPLNFDLPPYERNRMKQFKIKFNPDLNGSPARNFTAKGLIETGTKWKQLPFPLRLFILLHEIAHFYYIDETLCDLWAADQFIKMGYNNSSAYYALAKVLTDSNFNQKRVLTLLDHLKK